MTLFFAAHRDIVPNFHLMSAIDDEGRTSSALEHKFRVWRQAGKKLAAEKSDIVDAAADKDSTSVKKTRVKKVKKDTEDDAEEGGDEAAAEPTKKTKVRTCLTC